MRTMQAIPPGGPTTAAVCALLLSQITTFGDTPHQRIPTQPQTFQMDLSAAMAPHLLKSTDSSSVSSMALPPSKADKRSASAPIWLKQRMDASLKRRPGTLAEIQTQYKASMEVRRRSNGNQDS